MDNNWYTNYIARWCLRYAAEQYKVLKAHNQNEFEEIFQQLNISSYNQFYESEKVSEITDSDHLSSKMFLINLFLTTNHNVMYCLGIAPVEQM